ncbi:HIT family protein [Patescibacteria group bacterium]|nr:HIT family protein [Patescibacteria group bacterium]
MEDCLFCKIIKGKILSYKIWEDENFFAFLNINPINPGHTILVPKKHLDYIFDLEEPLYSEIFKTAKKLSRPLKKATGAEKIGLAIEGLAIRHIHIHLVPVNKVNDLDPNKAKKASPEELLTIVEKVKSLIKF